MAQYLADTLPTSLQQWKDSGQKFTYKGHSIFVKSAGNPAHEPLLLIHGFPTASWDWEPVWSTLTSQYRVYTLDLIGFGFSAKPKNYTYSIVDQADLCEAYLASQGIGHYHILAHDLGDSVAQELLSRVTKQGSRPKLLSLAFLNGGLFPETHRPLLIQRLLLSPLGGLIARLTNRRSLAKSMKNIFGADTQPNDQLINEFWSLLNINHGPAILPKLLRYMIERREHRDRWLVAMINAPIPLKLIDGVADPISGGHMVERFRQLIPNANVTELQGIGHYPQIESPSGVLNAYLAFRHQIDSV